MRIVFWNCGGAFHRKWPAIAALDPDLAVIAECCKPDRIEPFEFNSSAWVGRLPYKGLGMFGFGEWRVAERATSDQLEWVLTADVSGPVDLTVVGVWAMNHRARSHPVRYSGISQPEALVDMFELVASAHPVVVTGDFNSNAIWDTPSKSAFQRTRDALEGVGLRSLHHELTGEPFGEESLPTHWWRDRREDGPTYHIDYVWISQDLVPRTELRIGGFSDWVVTAGSDHAALIIDIGFESQSGVGGLQ